jgi:chromate transport protein ChrA
VSNYPCPAHEESAPRQPVASVALATGWREVIKALKQGRHWGWIAGLCIAGLYTPSGFMVLGIIMLVNLLKEESKEYCKKESKQASQAIGAAAPQPER